MEHRTMQFNSTGLQKVFDETKAKFEDRQANLKFINEDIDNLEKFLDPVNIDLSYKMDCSDLGYLQLRMRGRPKRVRIFAYLVEGNIFKALKDYPAEAKYEFFNYLPQFLKELAEK
jgi:hypothetical protein